MAPSPPTPKITKISCNPFNFEIFENGWKNSSCLAEITGGKNYVSLIFDGENLTTDYIRQSLISINTNLGHSEYNIINVDVLEEGYIEMDITFVKSETVQFNINNIISSWMPVEISN